jgi:hypothetical protein
MKTSITNILLVASESAQTYKTHTHELAKLAQTVLEQNWFQFNNEYYKQKGLAMGATSASLAKIYLQYTKHENIMSRVTRHGVWTDSWIS